MSTEDNSGQQAGINNSEDLEIGLILTEGTIIRRRRRRRKIKVTVAGVSRTTIPYKCDIKGVRI